MTNDSELAALFLDDVADLVEVLGGLREVLATLTRELGQSEVCEQHALPLLFWCE